MVSNIAEAREGSNGVGGRRARRGPGWIPRLLAVAILAGVSGGRPAFATDWSSFGLDSARTRATTEALGTHFAAHWRSDSPVVGEDAVYRSLLASPAVADGFIAAASYGNVVRVLRESDGVQLWEAQLADAVIASPIIDRGRLYVAGLDRHLYAFRLNDGHLVWKTGLGGIIYSSPVAAGGSVVVAAGAPAPRVMRIDAETGQVMWTAGTEILQQSIDSSVVIAGGHVIVAECNGRFHSFAFADGHHEWTAETGGTTGLASPVATGDRVYLPVGGDSARLMAVDLATGVLVPGWSLDLTSSIIPGGAAGTVLARRIVLSSLGLADGLILLDARADDRVDTDRDGVADLFRLREVVFAVDAVSGRTAWTHANGTLDGADANQIPTHGLVPTPGVHRALTGEGIAVVASTLAARVAILDLQSGNLRSNLPLPSPARASPAVANGRLILATDAGAIVALRSLENSAPPAPTGMRPTAGAVSDASATTVAWGTVVDVDGDAVSYQFRWDTDGEILHSAAGEGVTPSGVTTWRLPPLPAGTVVTYAIRARDSHGAWSDWSAAETFAAVSTPPVHLDSKLVAGLAAALGAASPGQTIQLGMGRYPLAEPMTVRAGVTLQGAAPHLTVLDGRGLDYAVTFQSSNAAQPSKLTDLTVQGAKTGVSVGHGAHVLLKNIIVIDNKAFGIDVGASGVATLMATTLYRNDIAARSFGQMDIRNSIIAQNRRGLVAMPGEAILSRYNDLFENREMGYENVLPGTGDMAREVEFQAAATDDLRVSNESATTDRGDPADDFAREPAPNGNRINMGAFAGTELGELSPPFGRSIDPPAGGPAPVGAPAAPLSGDHGSSSGCAMAPGPRGTDPIDLLAPFLLVLGSGLGGRRFGRRRPG
jgi:outer membrane protein assembly factor BamB